MQKKTVKRAKKRVSANTPQNVPNPVSQAAPSTPEPASSPKGGKEPTPLNTLKQNLTGKRKAIFEILDDVKKVKPEQWQNPSEIEQLAKNFANKLGLPVPEQRIKQFVNAYKDATKNGPTTDVDDLVKKYGQNLDEKTMKEIKKFVPKSN